MYTTLENGLQVSIYSNQNFPIVATQTWVSLEVPKRVLSRRFCPSFEHLMFGNTDTCEESTTRYIFTIEQKMHTLHLIIQYIFQNTNAIDSLVLDLEADRLQNLILDEEALNNEKKLTEELSLRLVTLKAVC